MIICLKKKTLEGIHVQIMKHFIGNLNTNIGIECIP